MILSISSGAFEPCGGVHQYSVVLVACDDLDRFSSASRPLFAVASGAPEGLFFS
jgi:hypothetical protein